MYKNVVGEHQISNWKHGKKHWQPKMKRETELRIKREVSNSLSAAASSPNRTNISQSYRSVLLNFFLEFTIGHDKGAEREEPIPQ